MKDQCIHPSFGQRKATEQDVAKHALQYISKKLKDEDCPLIHKNRLQEFTQQSSIQLLMYQTVNEGSMLAPQLWSSVLVDSVTYTPEATFLKRKTAEQDVAKHALQCEEFT
ncbi:hypothetical protein J1N35_018197 [Gossypium stocksii]|uniref:DRBM domain-containing protein n=1 Tax=Gossypium stocksii TaxID=47602 RepID=A0A9D4A6V1_9ROSI|nr:hypothetical protein J1N35_018197 [Gossypium stocksii]